MTRRPGTDDVTLNSSVAVAARLFVIVHSPEQEHCDRKRHGDIVRRTERRLAELEDLTGRAHTAMNELAGSEQQRGAP